MKVQVGLVREQWIEALRKVRLKVVTCIFVSGHVGVRGNERADQLASCAIVAQGDGAINRADVLNSLRDIARESETSVDDDSFSMARIKDQDLKCGVARSEHFGGRRRMMVNQQRTGPVSRSVMVDTLRVRSEQLWTCPV